MIPVQMRQQQCARERIAVEVLRDAPDPGARVEQERPRLPVVRQRDARRVTTDADEFDAGCRRGTADAAEEQPHPVFSWR
jgi:hypothetical protein